MIWIILGFIISYIIGIICWGIICYIEPYITTYKELAEEMKSSPAYIPIGNIVTLLGGLVMCCVSFISTLFYKYCGIKKLCNKIKNKKLPFKK